MEVGGRKDLSGEDGLPPRQWKKVGVGLMSDSILEDRNGKTEWVVMEHWEAVGEDSMDPTKDIRISDTGDLGSITSCPDDICCKLLFPFPPSLSE